MGHTCTQMERSKEIQTIVGQQSYRLYCYWLEKQRKKAPPIETFLVSTYYGTFIRFVEWSRDTGIPDNKKFIDLMIESKLSPSLWKRNEAYQIYMDYVDKRSDPLDQVAITIETISALSEGLGIPHGDVFGVFSCGEITELIQQRRLSPWLLFCSSKFREWTKTLRDDQRMQLMKNIGVGFWSDRLEKFPDTVKYIKEIAVDFGI